MQTSPFSVMPLLSDGMVLQRETETTLAGCDQPGQRIELVFRDQTLTCTTDKQGRWSVRMQTGPAGGPFSIAITGSRSITIRDVLIGEVWLASGQSNMQWRMDQCNGARADCAAADFPLIRYFTVPQKATLEPQESVTGEWNTLSPATAPAMSATGFYFARKLWQELQIPIGVVVSAWGGTPAETWTPFPAFKNNDTVRGLLETFESIKDTFEDLNKEAIRKVNDWEAANMPADPGNTKLQEGWANPDFDDSAWRQMSLPGVWQGQPEMSFNGVVWFRNTVNIPAAWRGKELELHLGPVDDFDDTYVNGERVGGMGKEVFQAYCQPRVYTVPPKLTKRARMTITVRAFDHFGAGGFTGAKEHMRLVLKDCTDTVPLHGSWRYEVEHRLPAPAPDLFRTYPAMPVGLLPEHRPSHVFNAMIHPLKYTVFAGVIWYQGESNGGRSGQYADLFRALIEGWRTHLANPLLPFLFVQLPNFGTGGDWPLLREAQAAALALPATGMAVTLDVGETTDIHPQKKGPVGERLALIALHQVYHLDVPCFSPSLAQASFEGPQVRLRFQHATGGLVTTDGMPPRGFELAAANGVYLPAEARLEGDTVIAWNVNLAAPCSVRYAFTAEPRVNVASRTGLPVAPFRLDSQAG